MEGVRGVYIATLINGSFSEENMRSVITFDKGGTWELLQPPAQTHYGEHIDCQVPQSAWDREETPKSGVWGWGLLLVVLEVFSLCAKRVKQQSHHGVPPCLSKQRLDRMRGEC